MEAHQKFGQASTAQGAERVVILRDVAAILERITSEFPRSGAAQRVRDGDGPDGMTRDAISEAIGAAASAAPQSAELPAPTREAMEAIGQTACTYAVPACRNDIAADLDLIVGHIFADTARAIDTDANRLLFSDPGRIASASERATLFADLLAYLRAPDPNAPGAALLPNRLKEPRYWLQDDHVVTDYGLSLATGVLAELLARHYAETGQTKAAEQTRSWIAPLVDISLIRADSKTITEPAVEESWMRSFLSFVELGAKWQASGQAGPLLDLQLKKLAAEMHSMHQSLRTGVLVGYIFDEGKDLDDPFIFGATDNAPLSPDLENAIRTAIQTQATRQDGWLRDGKPGTVEELDAILEPVRQRAAGAPRAQPNAAPAGAAAREGSWGPEVVTSETDFQKLAACMNAGTVAAQHDCALQQGVSPAAVAFSRAVEAPGGVILATGFTELGAVDMVYNNLAAFAFTYLVNGDPDIISIELGDPKAWYGDDMALAAFAGYPQLAVYNSEVEGHRIMPDGGQRVIVVDRIRAVCEGCSVVGHGLRHIDFDASGKLLGARAAGFMPTENLFSEDGDAQMLRNEPRWLQYRLTKLGYTPGMIDGRPGTRTRAALADFAREHCVAAQLGDDALIADTLANTDPMAPAPCAGVSEQTKPAAGGTLIGWYEGGADTGMRCTDDWAPVRLYTNRIMYHEHGCDFDTSAAPDFSAHATTVTCNGAGGSWTESIELLRRAPGLLSVVKDGYSHDYTRCAQSPTPSPTESARPAQEAGASTGRVLIGRFGVGQGTELSCGPGGVPLTLYSDRIMFHESGCDLDIPVAPDFTDHSTTMTCTGEGESWKESIRLLRRTPDVLTIEKDGYRFDYLRCPE